jgi:hypothetical protein
MVITKLALDRSARRIDADGRLHVDRSHISKAMVSPYYGSEIPNHEGLGLEPNTVYRLLRDPVELERGAQTFARLPILSEHVPVTVDAPRPDLVVGAIGSEITFDGTYLDADTTIWDAEAIAGIESNAIREFSCAYRYVAVMEPGDFNGEPYDGRMTEIQGNHLALVEVGRAGSDVIVADNNPFIKESAIMKMTKLGKALFLALSAASPVLAADSALPALVGSANRKDFKKADVRKKVLALDEDLDPEKVDGVIDSILDIGEEPTPIETPAAVVKTPVDQARELLAGKVDDAIIEQIVALFTPAAALDEGDDKLSKEDVATAMDGLRASLLAAEEAKRDVRDVVGDVIGMDSAAAVYGFALDHMKVDRDGVEGANALRALFKVASSHTGKVTPKVALDSDGMATTFPGANRFK